MNPFYDFLLFTHFLGLALALGASLATLRLALATKTLEAADRNRFLVTALALGKNASLGILLLLVSGFGMFFWKGPGVVMQWGGGMFHLKLTLVVILVGLLGYSQVLGKKARLAQGGPALAKLGQVGKAMLVVSLLTVLSAVLAFH